ncbi:hypothetical protein [Streptomyces sp. ALI-76-A]|uniref:hypothetical protein n=1 Tax=Streptomyces sp. ALI-76-A TaxID=3025736 RepID=UPI00256F20F1|nr:hypothetical protein [Streptomyces sp. ALI-76-A]MDL5199197.1 hypothetical protein [Streptomyces sp. ALI-76-A]
MVFIVLGVMLVDMLVIVYPSSIGYHWALAVKQAYAASLYESGLPSDERDAGDSAGLVRSGTSGHHPQGHDRHHPVPAGPRGASVIPVLFQ